MNENFNKRRDFLKTSLLSGIGFATNSPNLLKSTPNTTQNTVSNQAITLLITSDIHGQINTHDEFFWENNQAVYKKRGGLAVLKSMINHYKKQNPENTIVYDGGDFFHGHAIATMTEGEALIPIFNDLNYDLMLPGNWELV